MQGQGKDGEWRELSMFTGKRKRVKMHGREGMIDRAGPQRSGRGHRVKY